MCGNAPVLEPPTSRSCTMTFTKIDAGTLPSELSRQVCKYDKVNRVLNQSNQYCLHGQPIYSYSNNHGHNLYLTGELRVFIFTVVKRYCPRN